MQTLGFEGRNEPKHEEAYCEMNQRIDNCCWHQRANSSGDDEPWNQQVGKSGLSKGDCRIIREPCQWPGRKGHRAHQSAPRSRYPNPRIHRV